jgi:hypothetical protein
MVKNFEQDDSMPDWHAFRTAKFPFGMLEESIIAPWKTLAVSNGSASELPVFLVQANFVTGGLLLTFNGQHGSMDMAPSTAKSTLSRNVDVRCALSIPSTYPGLVTHSTVHALTVDNLIKEDIGRV